MKFLEPKPLGQKQPFQSSSAMDILVQRGNTAEGQIAFIAASLCFWCKSRVLCFERVKILKYRFKPQLFQARTLNNCVKPYCPPAGSNQIPDQNDRQLWSSEQEKNPIYSPPDGTYWMLQHKHLIFLWTFLSSCSQPQLIMMDIKSTIKWVTTAALLQLPVFGTCHYYGWKIYTGLGLCMESGYLQFIICCARHDVLTMDVIASSTCFWKLKDQRVGHSLVFRASVPTGACTRASEIQYTAHQTHRVLFAEVPETKTVCIGSKQSATLYTALKNSRKVD